MGRMGAGGAETVQQFIMWFYSEDPPSNTDAEHNALNQGRWVLDGVGTRDPDWDGGSDNRVPIGITIDELHVSISAAPGVGNHWDFILRDDGGSTAAAVEIANPNTRASWTVGGVNVAADSLLNYRLEPTSDPDAISWVSAFLVYHFT